jgi:hypothetical protein
MRPAGGRLRSSRLRGTLLSEDGEHPRVKYPMKLLFQSAIVFFGTLLAAALVAVGEPASAEVQMVQAPQAEAIVVSLLGLED